MDNKSGINLEEEKFLFLDDRREEEEKSYLTERSRISTLSRTELCSNRKEISPLETTGETSVELICRVVRRTNERHRERECEKKKEMNNHTTGFFCSSFLYYSDAHLCACASKTEWEGRQRISIVGS